MSMNIQFIATREIKYKDKSGCWKNTTQTERFKDVYQTTTKVTHVIHQSGNKVQAYVDWVRSILGNWNEEVNIYDYNGEMTADFEYPVLGTKIVNPGEDHIKLFLNWVETQEAEGFTIQTEVW